MQKQKSVEEEQVLLSVVEDNFLFRGLPADKLAKIVSAMKRIEVQEGQELMRQGDKADFFYIAESGLYEVYHAEEGKSLEEAQLVHIYEATPELGQYPSFGELALLYAKPRKATVVAGSDGIVWALDRAHFRLAHASKGAGGHTLTKVLAGMPIFSSLEVAQHHSSTRRCATR